MCSIVNACQPWSNRTQNYHIGVRATTMGYVDRSADAGTTYNPAFNATWLFSLDKSPLLGSVLLPASPGVPGDKDRSSRAPVVMKRAQR
jgi:hypothetical protein